MTKIIFILLQAQLVFAALLPYLGFTISYSLSSFVVWILKKMGKEYGVEASQHLTIGVETAVQNQGSKSAEFFFRSGGAIPIKKWSEAERWTGIFEKF